MPRGALWALEAAIEEKVLIAQCRPDLSGRLVPQLGLLTRPVQPPGHKRGVTPSGCPSGVVLAPAIGLAEFEGQVELPVVRGQVTVKGLG